MNTIRVLVLDDLEIIGENVVNRMNRLNETYSELRGVDVQTEFVKLRAENIDDTIEEIERKLLASKVHFIVLDRVVVEVLDGVLEAHMQADCLYTYNRPCVEMDAILKELTIRRPKEMKRLKGVILYTYDSRGDVFKRTEPATLRQNIRKGLPDEFDPKKIDLLLTYTEVYEPARLTLYENKIIDDTNYIRMGKKSDFVLYGVFVGEILFHRILHLNERSRIARFRQKNGFRLRNLLLLFLVFTSINLGSNLIGQRVAEIGTDSGGVRDSALWLALCIVTGLLLPALVILLRPDWIFPIEDES